MSLSLFLFFSLLITLPISVRDYLVEKITGAFGGEIHPRVIKAVTAVICNESNFDPTDKNIEKAYGKKDRKGR
jgi:hypothetical protein